MDLNSWFSVKSADLADLNVCLYIKSVDLG